MLAKRFSILDLAFVLSVFAAGCRDKSPPPDPVPPPPRASSTVVSSVAAPPPISPFASLIGDPATKSLDAHKRLMGQLPSTKVLPDNLDYLAFRRALAAGAPLWRRREMLAGEVIFGPVKSIEEAGGALARLDAALVAADLAIAKESLETMAAPLRLFVDSSKTLTFSPLVLAQTLSAAAYDLGLVALESNAAMPDGLPAVLADASGTLDFMDHGADVLAAMAPDKSKDARLKVATESSELRKRLDLATAKNTFEDRAAFVLLTGKLGLALRHLGKTVGLDVRPPYRARKTTAPNDIDELTSAFTIPARNFSADDPQTLAYVELGRTLFFDKRLSRNSVRACASCHSPNKGLADGTQRPKSLDPTVTLRHTPSLLYGSLQAAYMWDGRVLTAERQALGVIHARAEMGLSDDEIVKALEGAKDLSLLVAATGAPKITPDVVARALAAFQAHEFVAADAPLDRFARGDENALTTEQRQGLDVFVRPGRCARCHVPPFFGGSRPRDFSTPIFAILGVPTTPESKEIDPDRGRENVTRRNIDAFAFKTPTVRNILRTSPYFHHGAFRTLEQVIDFYDRGGGRGLGLSVPNQDPDVRKLSLTTAEKAALLEFLRNALTDATSPETLVVPPSRKP